MKTYFTLLSLFVFCLASNAQVNDIKIGYEEFPTVLKGHAADSSGNMYYSGDFKGQLKINDQVLQSGAGLEDIFFIKKDVAGKTIFSTSFGSASADIAASDGLMYANNNLYLAVQLTDTVNFQSISVRPYPGTNSNNLGCVVASDTSGNIKWVNRTSLYILKIYASGNLIHLIGSNSSAALMFNDSILDANLQGSAFVHLMMDSSGKLINYKSIRPRIPSQSLYSFSYLTSFSDGKICMLFGVRGDSSFQFGNTTIPLPKQLYNYDVLIKTDTAYADISYKVLNAAGINYYNTNGPGLTINLSKQDSIYLILTSDEASPLLTYDGLDIPVYHENTMVVLDSALKASRVVRLADPFAYSGNMTRKISYKTVNTIGNELFISGTYIGMNESPLEIIPADNREISLLPGLTATIDINGASRSFVARTSFGFSNGSVNWFGDHSDFENKWLPFRIYHAASDTVLIYSLYDDNVWNPRILNVKKNTLSGAMKSNADMADDITFVEYLADGSRVVMGYARGKTALDSSSEGIKNNRQRADAFIARIKMNGEVKWYKRFRSTLLVAQPVKLVVRDNKIYFLVNYTSAVNTNNYLQVDSNTYTVKSYHSLLGTIDTLGNIRVLNLENNTIKDAVIADFNFCANGDMALLTNLDNLATYPSFPQSTGVYLFRLNPFSNTIISARKFISTEIFSFQPSHVEIDKYDALYLTVHANSSGNPDYKYQTLFLYDGTNAIDNIAYENNVTGIDYGGLGILKMDWDKFTWYKRTSGNNGFAIDRSHPSIFSVNNKIIFEGHPTTMFYGDTSVNNFYWDNKLVMPDMHPSKSYFFRMDSSGTIEMQKTMSDFRIRYAKKRADGNLLVSGSNENETKIDTISLGYAGGVMDAIGFIIDSNFKATRSFRLATKYFELMSDMDVYRDSLVSFAYMAQTAPSLYLNRPMANPDDNYISAYLSSAVIQKNIVLPIRLISFNATRNENIVSLDWTIRSGNQAKNYIIQRSENGSAFEQIEVRNSDRTESAITYKTKDDLKHYGKYYYRLQINSLDGNKGYSGTVKILYPPKAGKFQYDINTRKLSISRINGASYNWHIFDVSGKTIIAGQKSSGDKLIDMSALPKGQYIIQTFDELSIIQTYTFIR